MRNSLNKRAQAYCLGLVNKISRSVMRRLKYAQAEVEHTLTRACGHIGLLLRGGGNLG